MNQKCPECHSDNCELLYVLEPQNEVSEKSTVKRGNYQCRNCEHSFLQDIEDLPAPIQSEIEKNLEKATRHHHPGGP